MIFEEPTVRRAEPTYVAAPVRKTMTRDRSSTSVAGEMMTQKTGTRLSKDWENVRDLKAQEQRHGIIRGRRQSHKNEVHYAGVSADGPYVRAPCSEKLEHTEESLSWHETKLAGIFKKLDIKGLGHVSLDKLQESFEMIEVPMTEDMFKRYSGDLLADGIISVTFDEFMAFHKAVWVNQPKAVHHRAGFKQAFTGNLGDNAEDGSTDAAGPFSDRPTSPFPPSPSAARSPNASQILPAKEKPTAPGVRDVKDMEGQLRRVYRKNANKRGHLQYANIPDVFKDLGLDTAGLAEVESMARSLYNVADADADGVLSFHEFVEFQNRYVASLETLRGGGFGELFEQSSAKPKVGQMSAANF